MQYALTANFVEGAVEMVLSDYHTHTKLSFDGECLPEEMVLRAIQLGVKHYAITDHIEINQFYDKEYNFPETLSAALEQLPALKEKYSEEITLASGIELGQPVHNKELAEKVVSSPQLDFIIGSCHMIRGYDDFYFLDYKEKDPVKLLDTYFEELLEMAEWGKFDVLGHLTYPLRYICGDSGIFVDMERYEHIIDEIFRTLIKKGCGIEINTSGLRQKIGVTLPELRYVKRYYDLGGRIITVGSDAHRTEDLGKGTETGIEIARSAGFTEIACYKNRNPIFIKI